MKKQLLLVTAGLIMSTALFAQRLYDDFDGKRSIRYKYHTGFMLDSGFVNPMPAGINLSAKCAKYVRHDTLDYDIIRMVTDSMLEDVTSYCSMTASKKFTMKVLSKMPIKTKVQLQLGTKTNDAYPAGAYALFIDSTRKQNEWEQLTFTFTNLVPGTMVTPTQIDKIILLFDPGNTAAVIKDTVYFDELTGPKFYKAPPPPPPSSIVNAEANKLLLLQNKPNPARGVTEIAYEIPKPSHIKLKLYNILGNYITTLDEGFKTAGLHKVKTDVSLLAPGMYFYEMKSNSQTYTKRMIVVE